MVKSILNGYAIELQPLTLADSEQVFIWRNNPEIRAKMTDSAELIYDQHLAWYTKMLDSKEQVHYKIVYKNNEIGVINLRANRSLNETAEAEIGLYIADAHYRGNLIAFAPSLLLIDFAFNQLGIKHLKSRVRHENVDAIRYNQQLGYEIVSEDKNFVIISLTSERYERASVRIKSFLSRK